MYSSSAVCSVQGVGARGRFRLGPRFPADRVGEHRKAQAPENSTVRQVTFLDNNNNT